jgi:hypothetical protein
MYILWQPFFGTKPPWVRVLVRDTSAMVVMYIVPLGQSVPQCFKFKVSDTLTSIYPQLAADKNFNSVKQFKPGQGDNIEYCGLPVESGATLRSVFLWKAVQGSMDTDEPKAGKPKGESEGEGTGSYALAAPVPKPLDGSGGGATAAGPETEDDLGCLSTTDCCVGTDEPKVMHRSIASGPGGNDTESTPPLPPPAD